MTAVLAPPVTTDWLQDERVVALLPVAIVALFVALLLALRGSGG